MKNYFTLIIFLVDGRSTNCLGRGVESGEMAKGTEWIWDLGGAWGGLVISVVLNGAACWGSVWPPVCSARVQWAVRGQPQRDGASVSTSDAGGVVKAGGLYDAMMR